MITPETLERLKEACEKEKKYYKVRFSDEWINLSREYMPLLIAEVERLQMELDDANEDNEDCC